MKKTVTLAELLTASGFTAGQHNDPETTEFYTRKEALVKLTAILNATATDPEEGKHDE